MSRCENKTCKQENDVAWCFLCYYCYCNLLQLRWFHGVDLCSCQQLPPRSLLVVLGLLELDDFGLNSLTAPESWIHAAPSLSMTQTAKQNYYYFLIIIFSKHLGEDLSSGFHPALLGLAGTGRAVAKWESREMELVKPRNTQPAIA